MRKEIGGNLMFLLFIAAILYFVYRVFKDGIYVMANLFVKKVLVFKTRELRDEFLENFRDLIKIAKPLL